MKNALKNLYWILVRKRLDYIIFSFFSTLCSSYMVTRSNFFHLNSVCDDRFLLGNGLTSDSSYHHHHHRSHIQFQLNLQLLKKYLQRLNYHHLIHPHQFVRQRNLEEICPSAISCTTIYLVNSSG